MSEIDEYLTVAQAARFVGVSPATLRRWDAAGTLVAVRRAGSKYRYYRTSDLAPFKLETESGSGTSPIASFFQSADAHIEDNAQLREPQLEAYTAVLKRASISRDPLIVQLPVGCGKTGLAAVLPFGLARGRVLVVAPNTTIREGLYADFNISNANCFWKRTGVLTDFTEGPFTALVDGPRANVEDCKKSHIVVANIQQLASSADRWLSQFSADFFDLIIVDEGHHIAADSWKKVVQHFPAAQVVSLTATPFRADNKELLGEIVYQYPFTRAMLNGYIKSISSASAHPSEITFTEANGSTVYTREQILEMREEAWFRRGVALSDECNRHIAEKALEKLNVLRSSTGFPHQIIASAMSIDHANQIKAIFEELGLQVASIHTGLKDEVQKGVLAKLRSGRLDAIVQVNKLGEGFDHPPLSVAAIFRPYRSLSPYIQFVGRIMRTVDANDPNSQNNQGLVVSHFGLNNEEQWEDFRELDNPDKELVKSWARGMGGGYSRETNEQEATRRFDDPVAQQEVVSHFLSQSFLDPDDDRVIEAMLDAKGPGGFTFRELGITASQLRAQQQHRRPHEETPAPSAPIQPQVRRQTLRDRLASRSKSVHQRILVDLGLPRAGYNISRAVSKARGNNVDALHSILNAEINHFVGEDNGSRQFWTVDQFQAAYEALDEIGDEVAARLREKLEEV